MAQFIVKKSIKVEILAALFFCLFLLTATLGYLSFAFSKDRTVNTLEDSAKGIASTVAHFISPKDVKIILLGPKAVLLEQAQETTHSFELDSMVAQGTTKDLRDKYSAILSEIKATNDIDSPINVYVTSDGSLKLVLSSEPGFPAGASYAMRPEAKEAYLTGSATSTDIYEDKDGTWISAYAPREYGSHKWIIVEINYKVDSYLKRLKEELAAIIALCVIGFMVVAFISYYIVTGLVSAIKDLNESVCYLEKGYYDRPVKIKADNEIGHLAAAFELLRTSIKKKIDELRSSLAREKKAHLELVVTLMNAIETRDPYTKEHLGRVYAYALLIAKAMHLAHDQILLLKYSYYLHDIGKIYIENALLKKGKLTEEDFWEIKKHSERGAKIIDGIQFLTEVKEAVLHHQERYDGKGYPGGLKGKQIPLLARIVSVADSFDAMTTDRPYKPMISFKEALKEIEKNYGTQFDPEVCAAFLTYRDKVQEIAQKRFPDYK